MTYQLTLDTAHGNAVLTLGTITKERHKITSGISQTPLQAAPEYTQLDDYDGVNRVILLTGEITGTKTEIMNIVVTIEAIQDGDQYTSIFHSDLYAQATGKTGNFNVKVDDFEWEYTTEAETCITYILTLFEGLLEES